uniref:RING-type domain-containing protein n=1 Tax=Rhabditophanes sp. KR3021 TaxID=114890 RepID=A0AC35TVX7_9BILA
MDDYMAEHASDPTDEERLLSMLRLQNEFHINRENNLAIYLEFLGESARAADPKVIATLPRHKTIDMDPESQCTICLSYFGYKDTDPEAEIIELPCKHKFHSECVLEWFKKADACPLCRHELPSNDAFYEELKRNKKREAERARELEDLHDNMFG